MLNKETIKKIVEKSSIHFPIYNKDEKEQDLFLNKDGNKLIKCDNYIMFSVDNILISYFNKEQGCILNLKIEKLRTNSIEYIIFLDSFDIDFKFNKIEFEDMYIYIKKEYEKRLDIFRKNTLLRQQEALKSWIKEIEK